jgi:hypothetical protein
MSFYSLMKNHQILITFEKVSFSKIENSSSSCDCASSGSIPACTITKAYLGTMRFLKEHLSAYNYSWINETAFTGEASRRLFNRYDGNQLLFVLNLYASFIEGFTVSTGLKIEDRLMNQLPVGAKSEVSVLNWLKQIPPLPVSNAY